MEVKFVLFCCFVSVLANSKKFCIFDEEFSEAVCENFNLSQEIDSENLDKLLLKNATGSISPSTFQNLSQLTYLSIKKSNIENVTSGAFASLPKLLFLVIQGNKNFPDINEKIFEGTTKHLSWVSIIDNNNLTIPEGSFNLLTHLTWLHLQNQHLKEVTNGYFNNTPKLHELTITNCGLEEISEDAFDNNENLEILSLNFNSIKQIHPSTFQCLKKLRILEMHHNGLAKFNPESFKSLTSLEVVGFPSHFLVEIENAKELLKIFPKLKEFEMMKRDRLKNGTKILVRELRKNGINIIGTPLDRYTISNKHRR